MSPPDWWNLSTTSIMSISWNCFSLFLHELCASYSLTCAHCTNTFLWIHVADKCIFKLKWVFCDVFGTSVLRAFIWFGFPAGNSRVWRTFTHLQTLKTFVHMQLCDVPNLSRIFVLWHGRLTGIWWFGGGGHVLHSPKGVMVSKLCSPNQLIGGDVAPLLVSKVKCPLCK